MKQNHLTAAELVQDPFFQKWVLQQDQEAHAYWSNWLQEYPDKEDEVRLAMDIIKTLEFDQDVERNQAFVSVWQQVHSKTLGKPRQQFQKNLLVAACSLVLLVGGLWGWYIFTHQKTYEFRADYAITTFVLPDSSSITLSPRSVIRYSLSEKGNREVWLEGEAFFEVNKQKKTASAEPSLFTVHTKNADIEVLGTAFNLYEDQAKTQVVLTEGKVKVTSSRAQEIFLEPGEFAEVKASVPAIKKKQVNTDLYVSWKQDKLRFESTPLGEIALWIEDRFDRQLKIPEGMDTITFTATLPKVELQLLLKTIKVAYGVELAEKDDEIIISKK